MRLMEARKARPFIKEMLLGPGGSATVDVGGETRMLHHDIAMDRPAVKLPWPLSGVQQYTFHFVIVEKKSSNDAQSFGKFRELERETFGKGDLDRAIDRFLSGLDPTLRVAVSPEGEGIVIE